LIKEIKILIDRYEVATCPGTHGMRRNIKSAFPDWQHGFRSGFEVALDLSRYDVGEHDLCVVATDDAGRKHELQSPLLIAEHRESERKKMALAPRLQDLPEVVNCQTRTEIAAPVTVAISLYNYRDEIILCLESVKSQTLRDLDLIVVDDCSTDDSFSVVNDWISKNENRFRDALVIRHKSNRGLPFARNSAFARARTEFVFVLDADNLLYPRCLERLLVALSQCDASFAYCLLEKFGEAIGIGNTRPWNPITLQHGNFIDAMVLQRKSVWEDVAGYAIDMPAMGWEDFDLWFRIARAGGWGVQVPEILARYRVRRGSMLHTITNPSADKLWEYLRGKYGEFFVA
jgi:GT2 family glycosyltransferase